MEQQEAVIAASTAIMGENVLDSPNTQHLKTRLHTLRNHSTLEPPRVEVSQQQQQFPPLPDIGPQSAGSTTLSRPDDSNALNALDAASNNTANSSNAATSMSVGIMAQGLAWAQMQRNRRKQLYLQHQAEQQLEKIRYAEERAQQRSSSSTSVLEYIPSLQSIMRYTGLSSSSSNPASNASKDSGDSNSRPETVIDQKTSLSGVGYSVELPAVVDTADSLTRSQEEIPLEEEEEDYDEDDDDTSWIPPVRVEEESLATELSEEHSKFGTCPYILSPDEMHQIAIHVLPRNIAYCKWKRCYSLARDGDSFATCLRAIELERPTLLVVRTAQGARFGGYADAPWWEGHGVSANYCGGPDACLFRIVPSTGDASDAPETASSPSKIICYRWTGANRYIQLCDVRHKMLAFGGGGGNFGLCLEQDFQYGSSGTCATFDNAPLAGEEQFSIVDLEIYGFLLGQF